MRASLLKGSFLGFPISSSLRPSLFGIPSLPLAHHLLLLSLPSPHSLHLLFFPNMDSSSTNPNADDELVLDDVGYKVEKASKFCLIGKVLAPKTLNRTVGSSIINSAWKTRGTLTISPWSANTFLFHFTETEDGN
ncbi:hypothetical protein ACSBR1_019460 [Camellia fascicularis]